MSEYSNKKTRGAFIAAVFAMQGLGITAGGVFAIVLSTLFEIKFKAPTFEVDPIGSTVPQADYLWRIVLMAGALPAAITFYWRLKMPKTARYTALIFPAKFRSTCHGISATLGKLGAIVGAFGFVYLAQNQE
ncbi:hypothetical protein F8388_009434 [Cannabis sativa]|uniref:Major facilitator superfamily (MFS) profile domain-containing protein n=1 Tax=Cannabis sativa TaxID=3483 RepID=A0A7J6EIE5_CANSA|nr:hypothetical protein F8388_009434 [Cannabis sativa]